MNSKGMRISLMFTARRKYASAVSRVVILSVCPSFRPSVCLSFRLTVTCVLCDKTKQCTADILIPHVKAITLVFWHQQWLVGDAPFVWNLRQAHHNIVLYTSSHKITVLEHASRSLCHSWATCYLQNRQNGWQVPAIRKGSLWVRYNYFLSRKILA